MPTIPRLHPDSFDWFSWCGGSISDLGIPCREACICSPAGAAELRRYAVGYLEGESLICRPKAEGEVAVMVEVKERRFWFHIRRREFEFVFGALNESNETA